MEDRTISIGGQRFDPLEEQSTQQDNNNNEPEDPDLQVAWIVQFNETLDAESLADLRVKHGLRLTDYIPQRSYFERLTARRMAVVRRDPRVRAVVRFAREFKLAQSARQEPRDDGDNEPHEPPTFDVVLFPDADPETVAEEARAVGGNEVRVLDDRGIGGTTVVRLRVTDVGDLDVIAQMEEVRWIEAVPETVDDGGLPIVTPDEENELLGPQLHGEGQVLGLIDKGPPDLDHCFFRDDQNVNPGPGHRKILQVRNVLETPPGGHATFTAGCAVGDDVARPAATPDRGLAWAAKLVCGNRLDLPSTTLLAELAAAGGVGARVHSNSYHSKPQGPRNPATYDPRSSDVDTFTWLNEDHLVVGSSGNTGEEQGPPGTAKNALCVSCSSADPLASEVGDGNPGPTADGRRKPDLTATGCHVRSALEGTRCGTGEKVCASSWATPRAAAAAVIVRQFFTEGFYPSGRRQAADAFTPTGALLKAVLVNAASRRLQALDYPNDAEGWGHLDPDMMLPSGDGVGPVLMVWDVRNAEGVTTGQVRQRDIEIVTSSMPLKITLAWTEPPGAIGSDISVVNDLDLVVTAPNGPVYRGNALVDGTSVEGGEPDRINNVEVVLHPAPVLGTWRIEVRATEVNVGAPGQGYALVATGGLKPP